MGDLASRLPRIFQAELEEKLKILEIFSAFSAKEELWGARFRDMGVSENSVPLFTQWLMIIIPFLNGYFIGNIPYFQTNPYGGHGGHGRG